MQDHNNILSQYLKRSASLVAAFIMLSFTASGHTSVITSGCSEAASCTLEELFAGGSITVNNLVFENWGLGYNGWGSDLSQIVVTGIDDGGNNPGPGLRYDANGQLSIFLLPDYEVENEMPFSFNVATTEGGAHIKDASLTLIDSQFDTETAYGGVQINECLPGITSCSDYMWIGSGDLGTWYFDSVSFENVPRILVENEINIYAFGQGTVGIESFEQRFSVIPVPPALWLFGSGLLGLAGVARKKVK